MINQNKYLAMKQVMNDNQISPPPDVRVAEIAFRFSPNPSSTMPLLQMERIQTIGFRREDLVRTHWREVWHATFEE